LRSDLPKRRPLPPRRKPQLRRPRPLLYLPLVVRRQPEVKWANRLDHIVRLEDHHEGMAQHHHE